MKILITGANGLLGQKLISLLQQKSGVEIIATGRGENRILGYPDSEYHKLDVENEKEVLDCFKKTNPEVVIHTAAMTHVDDCELNQKDCYKANVIAVQNVVNGCSACGTHLVHLSTDFIFDGSHGPLTEDAEANPINYYGESKLEAEQIIRTSDISWSIARTVLVYGIVKGLKRSNIILWVKDSLENNKPLNIVDDQWRTPTLAEDLAQGCYLLAKDRVQGIFNISGEELLTPYDMSLRVTEFFSLDKSLISRANSTTFTQPAKRPPKTGFIIDKAKEHLEYQPHSFDEGIALIASQINQ